MNLEKAKSFCNELRWSAFFNAVLKKLLQWNWLSFEELSTTLMHVEGMINSQPMTYVYSNRS